jgi:hypothetical protein
MSRKKMFSAFLRPAAVGTLTNVFQFRKYILIDNILHYSHKNFQIAAKKVQTIAQISKLKKPNNC